MSVSAKIHVNGAGRPNRDDTFRLRAAELDKPAILSAMSEKNVFTTAPGKENVPTGADGSTRYVPFSLCTPLHTTDCTSERYASSNLPNKRGRPCGMNKDGKPLWMLTNPKEERGTVVNMFWKQITEVNRECGLEALQALLGVLPTGASDPTIDSIVATITDPVFASIDTEALDRGASRSERVSGITG
jgi:hypothetical protein